VQGFESIVIVGRISTSTCNVEVCLGGPSRLKKKTMPGLVGPDVRTCEPVNTHH
jgi:hypothetical protein